MTFDYSKLSDSDLEAFANEDYHKMSDEGLKLVSQNNTPEEGVGGMNAGTAAIGAAQTGYETGKDLVNGATELAKNPIVDAALAYKFGPKLLQAAGRHIGQGMGLPAAGPVAPSGVGGLEAGGQKLVDLIKNHVPAGGAMEGLSASPAIAAFSAPYLMAAHEQEKIRQNPNAPEYANNPFAMQQRGVAPTLGAAGAMNQRAAVAGQQYGGLQPHEQAALQQDKLNQAIRIAAAKKALGQ